MWPETTMTYFPNFLRLDFTPTIDTQTRAGAEQRVTWKYCNYWPGPLGDEPKVFLALHTERERDHILSAKAVCGPNFLEPDPSAISPGK